MKIKNGNFMVTGGVSLIGSHVAVDVDMRTRRAVRNGATRLSPHQTAVGLRWIGCRRVEKTGLPGNPHTLVHATRIHR